MASKRRNIFHNNKTQEMTENGSCNLPPFCDCSAANCATNSTCGSSSTTTGRPTTPRSSPVPHYYQQETYHQPADRKEAKKKEKRSRSKRGSKRDTGRTPGGDMEGLKVLSHPNLWPNIKQHVGTSLAVIKNPWVDCRDMSYTTRVALKRKEAAANAPFLIATPLTRSRVEFNE
ncbi:hypothetical protein AAG570_005283 [Ranatra chinensis]|uniref:Uncharacterized protein n=1 Tax=Ranatra chinensis TaxID=642074 RepID=A0ABD0Y0A7_9HEMI